MPLDPNLNINYTAAQKTAITTDLTNSKTGIEGVIVNPLNLSDKERRETPSIDKQREMFVTDAVITLAPQYPNLLGPEITAARAKNLWEFRNTSLELLSTVDAMRDQLVDAIINAENICLKFTEDMRGNAQRYKERNVPGADVVWDRLQPLHDTETSSEPSLVEEADV